MTIYRQIANPNATNSELDAKIVIKHPITQFEWAVTDTWDYEKETCVNFYEFQNAKDYAQIWSKESKDPIYLWKLTNANPIKWMEVSK